MLHLMSFCIFIYPSALVMIGPTPLYPHNKTILNNTITSQMHKLIRIPDSCSFFCSTHVGLCYLTT